mgnify:CR=1 FL=1
MNILKKAAVRVVAIVLVAVTAITLCIGYFIFKKDKPSPSGTAYIDFGCLLEEGDEVTVEKVTPAPVDKDVEIYAFDFRLSSGQPDGAIEIIIPYSDKGLKEEEELLSVCGKYLNQETNEWEDVFYTVDTEANKVHIITNHLSTYGVFKITNPGKRSEYISEVNVYAAYMTDSRARAIVQAFAEQSDSWQENAAAAFLETTDTLRYFAAANAHTFFSLGEAYDAWVTKPFQNFMSGLGVSTACAQLACNAYNNGFRSAETTFTAVKSTLDIAVNFATPSIKLAYLSIGIIDISLSEVKTFAVANKYQSTKNMYDAYYKRKGISRTMTDWRKLFESYYKSNKDNPQLVLNMMKEEIDRYVNEYWTVAETDWESWIEAYDKNGNLTKYPWPLQKDRENISAIHKAELYEYLDSVFRTMCRNMYLDSLIEREKEYKKVADILNTKFSIVIKEDKASDKQSTWAGCYARLAPLSSLADPSAWTGKLNSDGGGTITFTLLAHLKAGFPMTVELYRTTDDIKNGKMLKSVKLTPFSQNTQTIVLEPKQVDQTDESGAASSQDAISSTPSSSSPSQPVKEANPWYDVTIVSLDNDNPRAFAGWYAVLEYPKDMNVKLKDMLAMFDNKGKCVLRFQKSDYEALESPSKIWLYQSREDLLSKKKPDVTVSFSLSGSYSGEYFGEPLYTILVRAKPKENKEDNLNSISGDYSSYMTRSELFIPGEGMMQIDKKENYEPWEKPSADVWLHYNGPSLTLKSYGDPYLTEHVLEKFSDSRYELTYRNGTTTVTHTVEILSAGYRAKYTFLSETDGGQRNLSVYILEKKQ